MLQPGRRLSHYRLVEVIGKGGMGEVWRAADDRLGREVALKVLPEAVTRDPGRLDRFQREAKLLAALNHAGIATIHDVSEHEGVRFLVMELVPGEDLAQVLERGPLAPSEAVEVALHIARAVEYAHARGVVHRDLKPANVKRAPDGAIKVLDFGLAKAMDPEPSSGERNVAASPTVTSAGTVAGVILGTAAYMSPEQARGHAVDKRTDVWSFGVLLYELLTADNPFRGETVADSVGAILHRSPDLDALPEGTPAAVRRVLRRCLTRERAQRLHDIADARIELEDAFTQPEAAATTVGPVAAPRSKLPWILLAAALPLVGGLAWWAGSVGRTTAAQPLRQFEIVPEASVDAVEISPDGARIAYVVGSEVFVRSLDTLATRKIADLPPGGSGRLFWAPDGGRLGLEGADGEFRSVDLASGSTTILASVGGLPRGPTWGDDGYIYFVQWDKGIQRFPDTGGAAETYVEQPKDLVDYHGFAALPGGHGIVAVPHRQSDEGVTIIVQQSGKEPIVVFESDAPIEGVRYSPTGHLVFFRSANPKGLWCVPFSLASMKVTGPAKLVVPSLRAASLSRRGDLVYTLSAIDNSLKQQIVWADRTGTIVRRLDVPMLEVQSLALSPDGSKVAVVARGVGNSSTDKHRLWTIDVDRKTVTRLAETEVRWARPAWSEDGTRLAFVEEAHDGGGPLVWAPADGSQRPEPLGGIRVTWTFALTPDWSLATFMAGGLTEPRGFRVDLQTVSDSSTRKTLLDSPDQDGLQDIHPTGKWIAYISGTVADFSTMVRPFPEGQGQWKASVGAGGTPLWSPDGKTLYYTSEDQQRKTSTLWAVDFDGSGKVPRLGRPVELFSTRDAVSQINPAPDGTFAFVVNQETPEGEDKPDETGIVVMEHWLSRVSPQ